MDSFVQFSSVVWRMLYAKRLRRQPILTVVEVVVPLLPFLFIEDLKPRSDTSAFVNSIIYPVFTPDLEDIKFDSIYIGPEGPYCSDMIEEIRKVVPRTPIYPMTEESDLVSLFNSSNITDNALGLYFKERHGIHEQTVSTYMDYMIMFSSGIFHFREGIKPNMESGPSEIEDEVSMRVTAVQAVVEMAHVKRFQNSSRGHRSEFVPLKVRRRPFPFPMYHEDQDNLMYFMPVRLYMAFIFPFCLIVYRVVEERVSGMQGWTRLLGLSRARFWLGIYVTNMSVWLLTCFVILGMMTHIEGRDGVAFIFLTDPSVLYYGMALFCSGYVVMAMLISIFFNAASFGTACAIFLWSATMMAPFLALHWTHRSIALYCTMNRNVKLFTALIPLHGLYYIFRIIELYESYENRLDWAKIYVFGLHKDNVSPFEIMISMGCASIIFAALLWYLELVLPWTSTAPLPLYFPLMRSYWMPPETEYEASRESKESKSEELPSSSDHFEEEPRHLLLVIETASISKKYHRKYAVDHVTARLYQNQIFVLLGHSGSGKTTLAHMLAGLVRPSSGTAIIEGFDLLSQHVDALVNVSLCPQRNCLYDELSLYEHLYFFAKVQEVTQDAMADQLENIIKQLRLSGYINTFPRGMSSAIKRKLCIAIAVVADPKILVLDEPTAGLDITSRHEIWELIQKVRKSCTILLTTQDMEEADMLADRIAIIANGSIRCCGSPNFLKSQFGTGYHLLVHKRGRTCNVEAILLVARAYVPTVKIMRDNGGVLRLALGVTTSEGFVEMFKVLERFRVKLGITEMAMSVTTMEDVYIKVANELAAHAMDRQRSTESSTFSTSYELDETDYQSVKEMCALRTPRSSLFQQTRALLSKRLQYTRKQWQLPLVGIIFPALIFSLQQLVAPGGGEDQATDTEFEYSLSKFFGDTSEWRAIMSTDDMFQLARRSYLTLIEEKAYDVHTIRDIPDYFLELGSQDMRQYGKFLVGAQFYNSAADGRVAVAWYSGEAYHTAPISMNLVHTALLRNVGNEANTDIKVTVRIAHEWYGSSSFSLQGEKSTYLLMARIILFSIATAVMTSSFGVFPVVDRVTKAKHLQLMTGLSSRTYWFANFLFDFIFYTGALTGVVVVFLVFFPNFTTSMYGDIIRAFVSYGVCTIPMTYLLSFSTQSPATIFCVVVVMTFFSSLLTGSLFLITDALRRGGGTRVADLLDFISPYFSLNPPYALVYSFLTAAQATRTKTLCETHILEAYRYICPPPGVTYTSQDVELQSDFARFCCPPFNENNRTAIPTITVALDTSTQTLIMLTESALFFIMLMYFDSGSFGKLRTYVRTKVSRRTAQKADKDDDVQREENRARTLITTRNFKTEVLGVLELTKRHRRRNVVNSVSFVVREGEILGALGGYGAGKTTVFRLLTGDLPADKGQALVHTAHGISSLRGNVKDWQSNIGYCPEHDGFLEQLTAWDMLMLFARLRGVPEHIVAKLVIQFARIVDIERILHDRIETYSGGSKRKLSLGLALIGLPPVVILDEPTTGVDVISRRKIWTSLKQLQCLTNTAIIMSSHSIEECEQLCDRILIMMDGEIQCMGSIPHLKTKFAQGYTMTVKTHMEYREDEDYMNKVLKTIQQTFPASVLQESYEGHLEYHLPNIGLTWSQMFAMVEWTRKKLNLMDFLLRDTTLDQIYVTLAKKEVGRRVDFEEETEDQDTEYYASTALIE